MKSTNPQQVGLIFRTYARKIHTKASPSDPNFLRISVACGKVSNFLLPPGYPSVCLVWYDMVS